MTNLTIVIDDDILRAARIKALQEGTSVNEICREAITRYAKPVKDQAQWMRELRELQAAVRADSLREGAPQPEPMWPSREAMYDEIMAERMPTLWAKLTAEEAALDAAAAAAVSIKPSELKVAEPAPRSARKPGRPSK